MTEPSTKATGTISLDKKIAILLNVCGRQAPALRAKLAVLLLQNIVLCTVCDVCKHHIISEEAIFYVHVIAFEFSNFS